MNAKYLLGIALAAAAAVAACGGGGDSTSLGGGAGNNGDPGMGTPGAGGTTGGGKTGGSTPGQSTGQGGPSDPSGPTPTSSPTGKDFFIANVYPFLQTGCASCHVSGAGGAPMWLAADADTSYKLQFTYGFVSTSSMILTKGAHGGSSTNVLTSAQQSTYLQWVAQETKDGGQTAQPNVFEKLAGCMDQTKFDAIGLANLRTIQRTANNNTNNVTPWNENANRCTGCNNAPCRDCHAGDPASNFINAYGNNNFPASYTFEQTKLSNPAYIQHYFGTDATGNPIASHGLEAKATAVSKGVAYSHPYFTLTTAEVTAIQAFVDDAISKYKAGTCTGTSTPATP